MKKQLNVINTKSHGYVLVDDSEIKEGDWCLMNKEYSENGKELVLAKVGKLTIHNKKLDDLTFEVNHSGKVHHYHPSHLGKRKLIATSTEHKIEGVLQYVIVDDFFNKIWEDFRVENPNTVGGFQEQFIAAKFVFKAAKEKYPFSEEDIINFSCWKEDNYNYDDINSRRERIYVCRKLGFLYTDKELVSLFQSLKQPTLSDVVSINVDELGNYILTNGQIVINL